MTTKFLMAVLVVFGVTAVVFGIEAYRMAQEIAALNAAMDTQIQILLGTTY